MGCGNSKQETVHDPVKPNNLKDTKKTPNKNQNCAKEEYDYQLKDQHARKEVMRVGCESSKPEHAHAQEEDEIQDKTSISLDRSHSNLQETDDYQKIDQHPKKEVMMVGCEGSKPEHAHVQEEVETQDKTSIILDRSHSNLQETDDYQKVDQHPKQEVMMVGYESSKPEHAHVQEEVETQDKTSISLDRSHSNLQETDDYQKIDQHPKQEVIMADNESSKSEHDHVQEEVETQDKTSISLDRSHSNLQETDDYQKIDQHPKRVLNIGCGNSKQEIVHGPVKPNSKKDTYRAPKINQNRAKEVLNMDCGNSKQKTVHDPVNPNRQKDTIEASNKNKKSAKEKYDYELIDQHARKAPSHLKNSAEELVAYLSSVSKDPRMLARGFFVWSCENIKYDDDGYFGRAEIAPTDAESVMKNGKSVCEGYARVFKLLCSKAGIPVKKLSGFAKGYGYSHLEHFTLNTETDHAWNAVQLEGKWYLVDCTWGSCHLHSETNDYKKKFDDFYFLTDPKHFVSSHFPYMDDNLEESQKWQLLSKPLSLEEFNKNLDYSPGAFKIGAQAVSHTTAYFEMKNELQMSFKSLGKEDIEFSSRLMYDEGELPIEQTNATFGYHENDVFKILVHPQKPGMYQLRIFGALVSDDRNENNEHVLNYNFKCTEVADKTHEYPLQYASVEKCILHEPLRGNLPCNTEIQFRISAPYLQYIKVGDTSLMKQGTMFTGKVTTPEKGIQVNMYGTRGDQYSTKNGLYMFHTV